MRHIKQAKRLDDGEFYKGYYYVRPTWDNNGIRQISYITLNDEVVSVDPSTVEDVAVKPIKNYVKSAYECPNCDIELWSRLKRENYCSNCGQRIDWSEEKSL